jgi:hypothetical protein
MRVREHLLGLNFGPKWHTHRRSVMCPTDDSKRFSRHKREFWAQPTAATHSTILVGRGKIPRGRTGSVKSNLVPDPCQNAR